MTPLKRFCIHFRNASCLLLQSFFILVAHPSHPAHHQFCFCFIFCLHLRHIQFSPFPTFIRWSSVPQRRISGSFSLICSPRILLEIKKSTKYSKMSPPRTPALQDTRRICYRTKCGSGLNIYEARFLQKQRFGRRGLCSRWRVLRGSSTSWVWALVLWTQAFQPSDSHLLQGWRWTLNSR